MRGARAARLHEQRDAIEAAGQLGLGLEVTAETAPKAGDPGSLAFALAVGVFD